MWRHAPGMCNTNLTRAPRLLADGKPNHAPEGRLFKSVAPRTRPRRHGKPNP